MVAGNPVERPPSRSPAWRSRTRRCCPGAPRSTTCSCRSRSSSRTARACASDRRNTKPGRSAAGAGRAEGARATKYPLAAVGRHAAARLALPRADPRARAADARRALRRARRLHPRGAVVRHPRPPRGAAAHGHPRHPRPARGGVPRRQRLRHERAPRPHHRRARDRSSRARATSKSPTPGSSSISSTSCADISQGARSG
jgi:hypothetical protein